MGQGATGIMIKNTDLKFEPTMERAERHGRNTLGDLRQAKGELLSRVHDALRAFTDETGLEVKFLYVHPYYGEREVGFLSIPEYEIDIEILL
jgi:hypothetical protein